MKSRKGFVSNSSSSSFVISKEFLTDSQIALIRHYLEHCEDYGVYNETEYDGQKFSFETWFIEENHTHIGATVFMDNFYMHEYLEKIGVDMEKVKWGRGQSLL